MHIDLQLKYAQQFNQERFTRAQALLAKSTCDVLKLLPSLLHHNQAGLPGFIEPETPCGVMHFDDQESIKLCKECGYSIVSIPTEKPSILGVYTMGSLGSFGFDANSDIDVWIIHKPHLSPAQQASLQKKSNAIEATFHQRGTLLHCYLVHPERFIQSLSTGLGQENSGSTQNWLLLDEFYRTHICLAGLPILWWQSNSETLKHQTLCLGSLENLQPDEYFSASLWQLFQGIDAPHKALMKILLLEAYADKYPHPPLLSQKLWADIQECPDALHDPYLKLLEYITHYLEQKKDHYRLRVVRQCFYLKGGFALSKNDAQHDWRYPKMQELVDQWCWSAQEIAALDQISSWNAGQVQEFNDHLNQILLISYQKLVSFASHYELNNSMLFDELGILARKLHTRFSHEPSRIHQINSFGEQSLQEDYLNIMHIEKAQDANRFCVSPHPMSRNAPSHVSHYITGQSICALIFWCCLNRVAHERTQWFFTVPHTQDKQNQKIIHHFLNTLPSTTKVPFEELRKPWSIERAYLVLNHQQDPTEQLSWLQRAYGLFSGNLLSFGFNHKLNLLGSVELFIQNNWGEWHYHSFNDDLALLKTTAKLTEGAFNPDSIDISVLSCSRYLTSKLTDEVLFSLYTSLRLFEQTKQYNLSIEAKEISGHGYGLFFNRAGLSYERLDNPEKLLYQYTHGKISRLSQTETFQQTVSPILELIYDHAAQGITQYFIRQVDQKLDVFISNEKNELSQYSVQKITLVDLMKQVKNSYISNQISQEQLFNLPQFYWLEQENDIWHIQPFGPQCERFEK
tara:strand:+ start:22638 stop:25028 length:2391 start_codon:yes stop_codon:yes gene_type:complete